MVEKQGPSGPAPVSVLPSPSSTSSENLRYPSAKEAGECVTTILERYPDYGKERPKPYLKGLIETVMSFPVSVIPRLVHVTTGISGTCKNLPTVADFVELAEIVMGEQQTFVAPQRVVIEAGTPEWDAWTRFRGRQWPVTDVRLPNGRLVKGWFVPSLNPPEARSA